MPCPACGASNPNAAEMCFTCGRALFGLTLGVLVAERYEIQELLGKGGMGMVYKARDRTLDEIVALKILRPGFASEPDLEKRFLTEIKLARRVSHRNICRIHEYGEDKGLRYISMAYVEGVDLKRLLREGGPLPLDEAFDAAIQVAEGLQAVHDEGIVHRDLKPANMIRDGKGVVRLLDFGIAKQLDAATTDGLTSTGAVVGTPDYISPEQALGRKADARSDIYSLGVVIFELFTGQVLFKGDSAVTTLQKHVHEQPPLDGAAAARVPRNVVPILRRALAKDPSLRQQSARELSQALLAAREARDGARNTSVPGAGVTLSDAATRAATAPLPGPRSLRPAPHSEAPALAAPTPERESRAAALAVWLPLLAFAVLLVLWIKRGPGAVPPASPTPAASAQAEAPAPAARVETQLPSQSPPTATVPTHASEAPVEPSPSPATAPRRDPRTGARESCERGQGQACFELGEMLRSGRGGPRDMERAGAAFQRACELGFAKGCGAAGLGRRREPGRKPGAPPRP